MELRTERKESPRKGWAHPRTRPPTPRSIPFSLNTWHHGPRLVGPQNQQLPCTLKVGEWGQEVHSPPHPLPRELESLEVPPALLADSGRLGWLGGEGETRAAASIHSIWWGWSLPGGHASSLLHPTLTGL